MEDFQAPKKPVNIYEVLDYIRPSISYAKRRWWVILLLSVGISGFMFWREARKPVYYEAVNTFLLEDDILKELGGGSGGTSLLSILQGQGGATDNKKVLVDLALSYQLIEKTLLHSCFITKKWQSLANRYIELTNRLGGIADNKSFKGLKLDSSYVFRRNAAHDHLLRSLAIEISPNIVASIKESGIIEYKMTFWDEEFTRIFSENHIREISEYYIQKRLEKAAQLMTYTGRKMDSLERSLIGQEYNLASMNDEGFGVVMSRARLPELNYRRNISLITTQFLEAVAANNLAKLEYEKQKPIITLVDDARSPLKSIKGRPIRGAVIGLIIGLLLGLIGVVGWHFLGEMLKKQKLEYNSNMLKE